MDTSQVSRAHAHEMLGIKVGASKGEIKRAYKALVLRTHPDKNLHDATSVELFMGVSAAYKHLMECEEDDDEAADNDRCKFMRMHEEHFFPGDFGFVFGGSDAAISRSTSFIPGSSCPPDPQSSLDDAFGGHAGDEGGEEQERKPQGKGKHHGLLCDELSLLRRLVNIAHSTYSS
jgi:DnaJ-class molecular chaperone